MGLYPPEQGLCISRKTPKSSPDSILSKCWFPRSANGPVSLLPWSWVDGVGQKCGPSAWLIPVIRARDVNPLRFVERSALRQQYFVRRNH